MLCHPLGYNCHYSKVTISILSYDKLMSVQNTETFVSIHLMTAYEDNLMSPLWCNSLYL